MPEAPPRELATQSEVDVANTLLKALEGAEGGAE